jgi:hypothetical protein
MKEFKSNFQQVSEILDRKSVKEVKELFHSDKYNASNYSTNADIIADLVIENSNDFTKDIASRMKEAEGKKYFSAKQAWSVAYQVINNIELYKVALIEMSK